MRDGNQQISRSNKIPRKNNDLATVNNMKQLPTEKKKKIFIVGDFRIKNITGTGISRDHTVKIKPHSGAASINMCDYIKRELRLQPDVIILHCGTTDISSEINTIKKLKKLLKEIEGYDTHTHKKPQIVICSLMKIYDQDFNEDIKGINEQFKVCAHPKVCILLTIAILINHV